MLILITLITFSNTQLYADSVFFFKLDTIGEILLFPPPSTIQSEFLKDEMNKAIKMLKGGKTVGHDGYQQ